MRGRGPSERQTFFEFADDLQAVSCDEALLDVSSRVSDPTDEDEVLALAVTIRNAIRERTGCSASVGASHNVLLARCASRGAPDEQSALRAGNSRQVGACTAGA